MKRITKLMWAFCLTFCVLNVSAAEFYVSTQGNNENNGMSPETPVRTLNRINELLLNSIVAGPHTVYVSGMMDIRNEPVGADGEVGTNAIKGNGKSGFFMKADHWNEVTIKGMNLNAYGEPTDGFNAFYESRCFAIDGGTHYFENLIFQNGRDLINDGGNAFWARSTSAHFKNCHFINNTPQVNPNSPNEFTGTDGMGGALKLLTSVGDGYTFTDCLFEGNRNREGAAIYNSGVVLKLTGCTFKDQRVEDISNSNGGALYCTQRHGDNSHTIIERCLFIDNAVSSNGGAIAMGGAGSKNGTPTELRILNSSFINNESSTYGGAFYMDIDPLNGGTYPEILMVNSTFYGNQASSSVGYGGAIHLGRPGAMNTGTFTMINCTVSENSTNGGNGGYGAGIRVSNSDEVPSTRMKKRIYNCIIEGNVTRGGKPELFDFSFQGNPGIADLDSDYELIVANSYIGKAHFTADEIPNYPNMLNYYSTAEGTDPDPDLDYENPAGLDPIRYRRFNVDLFKVVSLESGNAPALTFGNADYLNIIEGLDIKTDQLYRERVINGNVCAVGAVEWTLDELEAESDIYENFPNIPTCIGDDCPCEGDDCPCEGDDCPCEGDDCPCEGDDCPCEGDDCPCEGDDCPCEGDDCDPESIGTDNLNAKTLVIINGTVQFAGPTVENVILTVITPSGAVVAEGINQVSVENLPGGIYIVKAQTGKETIIQKILK